MIAARVRSVLALSALAALLAAGACGSVIEDEARDAFRARLGSASFTVYPAYLHAPSGDSWDRASADELAAAIVAAGWGQAAAAADEVPVKSEPGMNQARMWRESAQSFAAWAAAHPPATDYAIVAEYLGFDPSGAREAIGIHAYVVDRSGTLVDGILLNSHHEGFAAAHPKTAAQCTGVLVAALRDDWKVAAAPAR